MKHSFFDVVTTIWYAFLPAVNKSLHAVLIKPCTVTTTEMHHPLPHYVHIHCLVSINIQQASVNVSGCHFFHIEKVSSIPLLYMHFHARHHCVRLPLSCHLSHDNKM